MAESGVPPARKHAKDGRLADQKDPTDSVIDIGNSSYKVGFFCRQEIRPSEHFSVHSSAEVCALLRRRTVGRLLLSSVSQKRRQVLENELKRESFFVPVDYKTLSNTAAAPLHLQYDRGALGTDRMAVATGSRVLFPKKNCLIVDFGTCITYNFVDTQDRYFGGGISPGVHMRAKALAAYTDALPELSVNELAPTDTWPALTTNGTKESVRAGVFWGIVAEVEGIIERYCALYHDLFTILCGGEASVFSPRVKKQHICEPALSLIGLRHVQLSR